MELTVAPNGSDDATGQRDAPLKSLRIARDRVRAWRRAAQRTESATIRVHGGFHLLDEPFVLTPEDSGTRESPLVIEAVEGETPILSVGERVSGWSQTSLNHQVVWTTTLPGAASRSRGVRQLWVNGERRLRARTPNDGWFEIEDLPDITPETAWHDGQRRFRFREGDLRAWDDAAEGEIVALHFWVDSHLPIETIDESERMVTLGKRSIFRLTGDHGKKGCIYSVENVLAALDQPGEWVFHRKTGILYYAPKAGETPETAEVFIGNHSQAVRFDGEPESARFVEHVILRGLTVSHTEWWLDDGDYTPEWPNKDIGGMVQAAFGVPGAVRLRGARYCRIEGCTVEHVGTYAIELEQGCRENVVVGNTLRDLGAGGVKIGETSIREPAAEQTHSNVVTDNVIASGGRVFHSAVGVWIGHSGGNVVAHNDIHDFYYTGISVGWSWGYGRSLASHNVIEHNHIHTIGQGWLSDMGAIYLLGVAPGTTVRNNLIHDITSRSYGGWGIYPDEGSSHLVIENNIVYRTNRCSYHLHYGKDNLIQNNVFALSGEAQICRSRPDPFVFQRNIVYYREGALLGGNWSELNIVMDDNVYFDASGRPVTPRGGTWSEWQAAGMDTRSLIADPLFENPEAGDFRLKADSPAWSVGFAPIDMSDVGPRSR
jgi:hypothetical protein